MVDKNSVERLYRISKKPVRFVIGLMSGTSLDGLDIALCRFTGAGPQTEVEVLSYLTYNYSSEFQAEVHGIFAKRTVDLQLVCLLNAFIGREHAGFIRKFLEDRSIKPENIDLIASHGQTIYHAPYFQHRITKLPNATLQIGDGDHIARLTGIITVSDFRQKHVAAGGEGAPLAVYGDYLIFSSREENRVLLNIGGISNFTLLPKNLNSTRVLCTDVGPGNTLMDAFVRANIPGKLFDNGGEMASRGKVNDELLNALLDNPFFNQSFPKTTGPELFNLGYLNRAIERAGRSHFTPQDILATLNRFTAQGIAAALKKLPVKDFVIYASGGGIHNRKLIAEVQSLLPQTAIKTTQDLGINPDAKEAVLFAALANECIAGEALQLGNLPAVKLGKISFPD